MKANKKDRAHLSDMENFKNKPYLHTFVKYAKAIKQVVLIFPASGKTRKHDKELRQLLKNYTIEQIINVVMWRRSILIKRQQAEIRERKRKSLRGSRKYQSPGKKS